VTQRFNPEEYALYRWLRNETWGHFITPKNKDYLKRKSVWAEDTEKIDTLKSWLAETPGIYKHKKKGEEY
jgi:hypothetical protein